MASPCGSAMFATCCPSAWAGSSIWRRPGSCSRLPISRNMFSSIYLTENTIGARSLPSARSASVPTATAATIAGRPSELLDPARCAGPACGDFAAEDRQWCRPAIAAQPSAQQIETWRQLRAQVGTLRDRRRAAEELVFDLIGAIDDDNDVVVEEGLQPGADAALHPLRVVVVADRERGAVGCRDALDLAQTCARRVRRSPAASVAARGRATPRPRGARRSAPRRRRR